VKADPFRDPTFRSILRHVYDGGVDPDPTCPNCGASVDLARKRTVNSVIYRHVMCRGCGVTCILEGPERNVVDGSNCTPA